MNLFHLAVASGNPDMMLCLLKQFSGKLVKAMAVQVCDTPKKQTFMHAVVAQPPFEAVHLKVILENELVHAACAVADASGDNALHRCCASARPDLLAVFVAVLPVALTKSLLSAKNHCQQTATHLAAENGAHRCLAAVAAFDTALLASVRNGRGQTPLHLAANVHCCEELVEKVRVLGDM
jgi:Ankyrin repeat